MTSSKNQTLINRRKIALRKSLLATLVAGALVSSSTGCSSGRPSLSSLNPFAKADPPTTVPGEKTPSATSSIASSITEGTKGIAASTKGVVTKSRDTVAGWFQSDEDAIAEAEKTASVPDPLRLDRKTEISSAAFIANGRMWENTGKLDKAMTSYAQALEKSPGDPDALTLIARLHFRQGNHAKAAEFFDQAIKQKPDDAGLYNDLGITLSKLGNYSAATETLKRALELSPGTSRYANSLASVRFDAGDTDGAFEVLAKNNKPAVAHFNMAYLHYRKGQARQASDQLTRAMQYENKIPGDKATEQAITRSRELLAQLQGPMNVSPAIPSTNTAIASTGPTPSAASPSTTGVAPTTAPSTGVPASGIPGTQPVYRQASHPMTSGSATESNETVSPGGTPTTEFQTATFRTPSVSTTSPAAPPSTVITPPATEAGTSTGAEPTESLPAPSAENSSGDQSGGAMMLPEGFTFPGI